MSGDDLGDQIYDLAPLGGRGSIPAHVAALCTEAELAAAYREVMPVEMAQREARAYFSVLERGIVPVLAQNTIERLARVSPDCARRVEEYRRATALLARRDQR
jgi:hypothetical protein